MQKIIGDRYILLKELGKNKPMANSKVYLSKDILSENEAVAVKTFDLDTDLEENIIKEFFTHEYISLKRLNHPSIIKYIDSGVDNSDPYIVMEYYYGKTLDEYIENSTLSNEQALQIAIKIAQALAYSHEKGIIHRDLKPNNIMIVNEDDIRIIDFGISKIFNYKSDSNTTLKSFMTLKYAAPEQLARTEVTMQSDIYSLGLVVAYMLSGIEPPDNKNNLKDYIENIKCSSEIKQLVFKLSHKDIEYRISSMHEAKRELEKQYNIIHVKNKKLYIKFNQYIQNKLSDMGLTNYSNKENAKVFLSNDLNESYMYRNSNNRRHYLIGKNAKYECRILKNRSGLEIQKVFSIEDQIEWDLEVSKGLKVDLPWIPVDNENECTDSYFEILNQDIMTQLSINHTEYEKNKVKNKLLEKWQNYLNNEFSELEYKNKVCNYSKFTLDDSGYKIIVSTDDFEYEIKPGELIQMTDHDFNQITVGEYEYIIDGKIYIKLKDEINPLNISNRGVLGIDTIQSKSNLKRFIKALNAIKFGDCVNENLPNILADPSIVSMNNPVSLSPEDFFQDILKTSPNSANADTVRKAIATKDIFLVQGPPGTGKSTVITEIVCQILSSNPKSKILLTSQSHVAVDHVVKKIAKLLPDKKIIRTGRSEKIAEESKNLLMSEQLNKWITEVRKCSEENFKDFLLDKYNYALKESDIDTKKNNLAEVNNEHVIKLTKIVREWYRRLGKLDEFDDIFAEKASVVASTCVGIASANALRDMTFDWVIVDEAARATPLELLVPIVKGRKIILVGDHRQLPPVIKSNINKIRLLEKGIKAIDLEKSLFEDLFLTLDELNSTGRVVLNTQYRMHPEISKLIADIFYPDIILNTFINEDERNHNLTWWPSCIKWIDTSHLNNNEEEKELSSKKNPCEANAILKLLEDIEDQYEKIKLENVTISVISGYEAQKGLLFNLIKPSNKSKWKNINISIDNIDAFQGSETDIVIYSLVRSNPDLEIGFLHDERRLNVALSRGRNALIIVGDMQFAKKAKSVSGNPFINIIKFIEKESNYCSIEVLNEN